MDFKKKKKISLNFFLKFFLKFFFLLLFFLPEEKKGREFNVGDNVDCLDTVGKWCVASVVEKGEKGVLVHYKGWSDKWNEWMALNSNRLAM